MTTATGETLSSSSSSSSSSSLSSSPQLSFQICLTAAGEPRHIVNVPNADTCSIQELQELAKETFGRECIELKSGFPPKMLDPKSMVRSVLSRNDRVTVILSEKVNSQKETKEKKDSVRARNSAPSESRSVDGMPSNSRGQRLQHQRAAAKVAAESFPQIIKAQEKLMKEQKRQSTSTSGKRKSSNVNASSSTSDSSRKLAKLPGRRLGDGEEIVPKSSLRSSVSSSKQRRPLGNDGAPLKTSDDVSFALLTALEHGGGGKVGQILRVAMRNAISQQYDMNRAITRVSAVQAGKYNISSSSASAASSSFLVVSFDKGLEGRGTFQETVDAIPREALELVLKGIHVSDPESLRAPMLAQLSPRVFWSLLRETSSCSNSVGRSIDDALQQLLPALDWSFLRRRKYTLSEKAKENLRQKNVKSGVVEENLEAAAEAVQAVEHAMEYLHEYDHSQRRNRAARAAIMRLEHGSEAGNQPAGNDYNVARAPLWHLITPTEQDEDELMECTCGDEKVVSKLIDIGIHNWRQLANAESQSLAEILKLDEDIIETWIDRAQQESVEEIIVEICDARTDVVEVFLAEANTGTPKDLANWRSMPDLLFETASTSLQGLGVSIDDIAVWSQRAYDVMQVYEWLSWYATPVD